MPELPEVEEVRRTLEPVVIGAVVVRVRLVRRDYLTPPACAVGALERPHHRGHPSPREKTLLPLR